MNKEEIDKKFRNLARAKQNNNDEVKTITRKQILSAGGLSFQGFIAFAKEIKAGDIFKGFSMTVCVTKFLNESEDEKSITIIIEEKKSANKDEVEQWKRGLSADGKTPPTGGNIKYIPNGNIHERTIKIGDLIELKMWNQNKEDFSILPTEVKDFDLLNFVNFTIDIRNEIKNEKNNILEYNNLGDFSLVGSGPKQFFEFINNIDLKTEITNVRKFIENDFCNVIRILNQGRPDFLDLKSIIGNEINRLFFFSTSNKYLDGTLDDFLLDNIFNSKRKIQIGLLKQYSDNTRYSIPVSIIYDQFNVKGLQHTIQFDLWKSQLLAIGINTNLFEKNYDKIMNNLDIVIQGKISKDSLIANKHLIDKQEVGNCIIAYVQKLIPIYSSLFSSIGLQINFKIVRYIIKHYFGTINFSTSKQDKKKKILKVLELANINELNKKKIGVYSLMEYDQNLNQFNNNKFFFFIIDNNNHSKANNILNEKFQSKYGDNEKKFDQILKHLEDGKSPYSASIQFDMIGTNRDKDALDFSIFAIEKEIYESWIDIDNKNKEGSEQLKIVLDDTYEKLDDFDENVDYSKLLNNSDVDNNNDVNNDDDDDDNDDDNNNDNDEDMMQYDKENKTSSKNSNTKSKPIKKSTTNNTVTLKKSRVDSKKRPNNPNANKTSNEKRTRRKQNNILNK